MKKKKKKQKSREKNRIETAPGAAIKVYETGITRFGSRKHGDLAINNFRIYIICRYILYVNSGYVYERIRVSAT